MTCEHDGCTAPAVARVTDASLPYPAGVGMGFAIIRPLHTPGRVGWAACADHTHHAIDLMLMRAMPGAPR